MSKKLPVGIQVYGLRDLLENTPENFKNVMQQVKELGYDEVDAFNTSLPNGKYLLRIDFAKSMERYISG